MENFFVILTFFGIFFIKIMIFKFILGFNLSINFYINVFILFIALIGILIIIFWKFKYLIEEKNFLKKEIDEETDKIFKVI
jgi:hypothetical protein